MQAENYLQRLQQPLQTRTNMSHSTNIKYRFHQTPLHNPITHLTPEQQACASFSLSRLYEFYLSIYLLYFPHSYSYLSVRVLYFAGPPSCQKYLSKPTCEVRDPNQPHLPWRVTIPNFGKSINTYPQWFNWQIRTNSIYRNIEHIATINSKKERISIATFNSPRLISVLGPTRPHYSYKTYNFQ